MVACPCVINLSLWWDFTFFPTTVTDSSLALRMTPFVLRHYDAFRPPLLVTCFPQIVILNGASMPCGKNRKRDSDTEWRIYYPDDILPSSSLQQQILHIRSGWRLTFPSLWRLAVSGTFISKQKSCQLMDDGRQRPEVGRRISTLFFCAIPSSQYPPATASMMSAALCVAGSFKKAPYWTADVPPSL